MNNWKNYTVNIGYVKEKTSRLVKFESNGPLQIQHISPGCTSCTKFIDYKDNILTLRYEASEFPKHLITEKESPIRKYVTVYYEDGSREQLNFVGFLIK
jgi:hypothetical protein